jgi:hypothetical protein
MQATLILPLLLFVGVLSDSDAVMAKYIPRVGKTHSDFVLPRIDNGEPIRLSQFRGKKVLLIHFASW